MSKLNPILVGPAETRARELEARRAAELEAGLQNNTLRKSLISHREITVKSSLDVLSSDTTG